MDRLRRLPGPAWVAVAFVLGIVIGLGVTWFAMGTLAAANASHEGVPGFHRHGSVAPYGPGDGGNR